MKKDLKCGLSFEVICFQFDDVTKLVTIKKIIQPNLAIDQIWKYENLKILYILATCSNLL